MADTTVLTRTMAASIVARVFEGEREPDDFFKQSLKMLGIPLKRFYALRREARKCERGRPAFVLCTPTGAGRNR